MIKKAVSLALLVLLVVGMVSTATANMHQDDGIHDDDDDDRTQNQMNRSWWSQMMDQMRWIGNQMQRSIDQMMDGIGM